MTPEKFREFLQQQILVIDGATGTMIQSFEFGPEVYGGEAFQMLSDLLVLSRPEATKTVHRKYLEAGANAVETNTFGASPLRLQEFDFSQLNLAEFPEIEGVNNLCALSIEEITFLINQQAATLATEAIAEYKEDDLYDGRELFVLGSIGPSNWVLSSTHADLKKGSYEQIENNFYQQVKGLLAGGVDILLFETQQDILELKVAIFGAGRAMEEQGLKVPIIAQITVDKFSKMQIFHTDIKSAITTIQSIGVDAFGINCSIGPEQMEKTVRELSLFSQIPISVVPNAGLPESENGRTVFNLTPDTLAEYIKKFIEDYGVNIVGGCCGTTPDHIKAIVNKIKELKPKSRKILPGLYISGPQNAVRLDSSKDLIRFGERLNVRGSKKVREAVEGNDSIDQDILEEIISEQVDDLGLEVIDICMDSNIVDTASTLVEVIQAQTIDFKGAFCLDSFDVKALESAIKVYPGRPIINSISLEEYAPGVDKIDAVLAVTKAHAPVYICLTTGPNGPATTKEEKLNLAGQIIQKVQGKYNIKLEQLFIDINAFPIGSESVKGVNFALESLQSIPLIKSAYPGVQVSIGVGNLTNGLAKKPYMRKVLTSVFLDEARKRGMDAAIVNPNHYVPISSLPVSDYQLGLKIVLEHNLEAFSELEEVAELKRGGVAKKKIIYDDLPLTEAICLKIKNGFKEREKGELSFRGDSYLYQDLIVLQVAKVLEKMQPLKLINDYLMVAMEELGAGFAEGTVSLPHLLKSADVMKQVMGFLESYIKKSSDESDTANTVKGTIVLGTVYQDVHSIGKDLTKTLLENYGFKVIDLGVQVPLQKFIDIAKENKADTIGVSALLVQTSNHMITLSKMMKEQGMSHIPLLIGGAPVTTRHAAFVAMSGEESTEKIRDNVFYCNSAMTGVNVVTQLIDDTRKKELLTTNKKTLRESYEKGVSKLEKQDEMLRNLPRRKITFEHKHPQIEPIATPQLISFTMKEFQQHLDQKQLFALNWRFGGQGSWAKKGITEDDLKEKLQEWIYRIDSQGWLQPRGVFGLFPCRSDKKGKLRVYDPQSGKQIETFVFNDIIGQGKKNVVNMSQYFSPDRMDVVGVQLTSAGPHVADIVKMLGGKKDDQEAAWLLQGLAGRVAEDLAEVVNHILEKTVWGAEGGHSTRFSPGYPALVDLSNNRVCADLLNATQELGIKITESFEFHPTETTAAVVCFHPDSGYH